MANIQFNNIKEIGLPIGAMPIGIDGLTEDLITENGGIINAVQIDWNGAQVAGETLNTTGEVLSLINDNIINIENVNSSLQNHTHNEYATKSYVTTEIEKAQIPGGGSTLNVEEFNNKDLYYNLLVAPDGSKYTTIGSLADDSDDNTNWGSNLCAQVNENGNTTLYSDNITCTKFICNNADIPHEHSNYYAADDHSHGDYYATPDYVTEKINEASIPGGGSSLSVTDFNDDSEIYNLLVAPVGSEYTTIGSLNNGDEPWYSYLYAILNKNGEATLATSYMVVDKNMSVGNNFTANYIKCNNADIPHTHTDYATTGHSHDYVATAGSAETAETAQYAATAGQAGGATHAVSADSAETADYAETTYHAEWADMAVKWNDSAIIHIGNQGGSLNAGDTLTLTLDDIGAASTRHEHSDYATTTSIENLQSQITQLISRIAELEELVGNDSGNTDTPTDPDLPDLTPQFYFYVGETEPTVDNYTTLCTSYSDLKYPSSVYYDVLSASGASVYILVSEDREVKRIVDSNNAPISYSSISTGINMAKVYKTVEIKGGERITITLRDIINQ